MEAPQVGLVRTACAFCGKVIWSKMGTRYYCTPSCKQKMYRWRVKLDSSKEKCISLVKEIASYLTYENSTPSALTALNEVISEAFRQMDQHNVKRVK